VIRSFSDKRTAALFAGFAVKGIDVQVQRRGRAKLQILDAAQTLTDLRVPPGNRLEALKGDRVGQHSIRINDQWRMLRLAGRRSMGRGDGSITTEGER
jgi:proteic killer suppression protein